MSENQVNDVLDMENFMQRYTALCKVTDNIPSELFDEYAVKRGLRDKNGNGVLSGLTNISKIESFKMIDGEKTF